MASGVAVISRFISAYPPLRPGLHRRDRQYTKRLRVEAAASTLEKGVSVQTVAKQCGFASPEILRRAFLRLRGMRPSAMRRG